jgi:hypothetical protein
MKDIEQDNQEYLHPDLPLAGWRKDVIIFFKPNY